MIVKQAYLMRLEWVRMESLENGMNQQASKVEFDRKLEILNADGFVVKDNDDLGEMKKNLTNHSYYFDGMMQATVEMSLRT